MFQSDLDVDMLQDEIMSCFKDCFIMGSLILNSFNGLCFEWVSMVELGWSGLYFEWVSMVKLGFNGLCFMWVLVVYVLLDYINAFQAENGWT
jgi:hypothetical protein